MAGGWFDIVGVVADTRWQDPSQPPPPVMYMASGQEWGKSLSILTRSSLDQESLEGRLRTLIREANPTVPTAGALAAARLLEGLLYEISPWHPGPYLAALAVIGVAAVLATLIPALRAATVAPLLALQQE